MPTDTRQRLIDAARQRFYRDGFRNVGLDAILADVGISKTAFYNHFESKDHLMVEVLETVGSYLQEHFRGMTRERGGRSALGQLRALFDVVDNLIDQEDFHGCIFVNAAMEFPLPHDPAHQVAVRHRKALAEFIFELAERARAEDPAALTEEICMIMEGAYVTRSLTRDPRTIGTARRLAEHAFQTHLPSTGPQPITSQPSTPG